MTEIYRDQTSEGLLNLYTEAREAGAVGLCDKIWDELLERERQESKEGLADLRDKLNQIIEQDHVNKLRKESKENPVIGCW